LFHISHAALRWVAPLVLVTAVALGDQAANAQPADAPKSFADLAENLSPAVVNISTSTKVTQRLDREFSMPDLPPGSPFEDFFKEFFDERQQQGPRKVMSLGSGFVIDPDGIVVTNNHVVEDADEVTVKFSDGTELEATVLGRDAKTDLAVLKVESESPLPYVNWGDSDNMRVGDWVMAIGNPFGLGGTVTAGIVSARNRNINSGPYDDFIQTDASINKGNSGGPLFNLEGQVIGVNTAIISPSGGSIGIGFSIPSAIAKNIILQLREYGETRRGWLGVRIQSVTPDIAESMDLDDPKGALVVGVEDDGPAKDAGIKVGDLIVGFDGKEVPTMRDLPRIVAETEIGKSVEVEIIRNGRRRMIEVGISRLEEAAITAEDDISDQKTPESETPSLGLTLSELTTELRARFEIADDVEGVVVVDVDPDSDAIDKVREGDVIAEVGYSSVKTPAEAIKKIDELLEKDPNKPVLLLLNRGGEPAFRSVRPKTPA
jgi:serine protease Do